MSNRDELINQVKRECSSYTWDGQQNVQVLDVVKVCDLILLRESNIVKPLIEFKNGDRQFVMPAIDQTLKNAGVQV